jgi:hypothetical protein
MKGLNSYFVLTSINRVKEIEAGQNGSIDFAVMAHLIAVNILMGHAKAQCRDPGGKKTLTVLMFSLAILNPLNVFTVKI